MEQKPVITPSPLETIKAQIDSLGVKQKAYQSFLDKYKNTNLSPIGKEKYNAILVMNNSVIAQIDSLTKSIPQTTIPTIPNQVATPDALTQPIQNVTAVPNTLQTGTSLIPTKTLGFDDSGQMMPEATIGELKDAIEKRRSLDEAKKNYEDELKKHKQNTPEYASLITGLGEIEKQISDIENNIANMNVAMPEVKDSFWINKVLNRANAIVAPITEFPTNIVVDASIVAASLYHTFRDISGKKSLTLQEIRDSANDAASALYLKRTRGDIKKAREEFPTASKIGETTGAIAQGIAELMLFREATGIKKGVMLFPILTAIRQSPEVSRGDMSALEYIGHTGTSALTGLMFDFVPEYVRKIPAIKTLGTKINLLARSDAVDPAAANAAGIFASELVSTGISAASIAAGSTAIKALDNVIAKKPIGEGLDEEAAIAGAFSLLYGIIGLYKLNGELNDYLAKLNPEQKDNVAKIATKYLAERMVHDVTIESMSSLEPIKIDPVAVMIEANNGKFAKSDKSLFNDKSRQALRELGLSNDYIDNIFANLQAGEEMTVLVNPVQLFIVVSDNKAISTLKLLVEPASKFGEFPNAHRNMPITEPAILRDTSLPPIPKGIIEWLGKSSNKKEFDIKVKEYNRNTKPLLSPEDKSYIDYYIKHGKLNLITEGWNIPEAWAYNSSHFGEPVNWEHYETGLTVPGQSKQSAATSNVPSPIEPTPPKEPTIKPEAGAAAKAATEAVTSVKGEKTLSKASSKWMDSLKSNAQHGEAKFEKRVEMFNARKSREIRDNDEIKQIEEFIEEQRQKFKEEKAIEEEFVAKVQSGEIPIEEPTTATEPIKQEEVTIPEAKIDDKEELSKIIDDASSDGKVVDNFPIEEIHFDPQRFQYKRLHSEKGETGSLSGVSSYDKGLGGVVAVWKDPKDNKVYVVNGHNRIAKAKELGEETHLVRFIKADNAKGARSYGALINIAEGQGSIIDAAKFFRDSDTTKEDLEKRGIKLTDTMASKALALSNLDERLFKAVILKEIPLETGIIIGEELPNHADQYSLWQLLQKNKKLTNDVVRELAQIANNTKKTTKVEEDLFGMTQTEESHMIEKAKIIAEINKRLSTDKNLFGKVAKTKAAERLEEGDNVIDVEKSKEISEQAAVIQNVFNQLKFTTFGELLERATSYVTGENNENKRLTVQKAVEEIWGEIERTVSEALAGAKRQDIQRSIQDLGVSETIPRETDKGETLAGKPEQAKSKPVIEEKSLKQKGKEKIDKLKIKPAGQKKEKPIEGPEKSKEKIPIEKITEANIMNGDVDPKHKPIEEPKEKPKKLTGKERATEYQKLHKEMRKKFAMEIANAEGKKATFLKRLNNSFNERHNETLSALESGQADEVSEAKLEELQIDIIKQSTQISLSKDEHENFNNKNLDDFDPLGGHIERAMDLDIVVELIKGITGKYPYAVNFSNSKTKGQYDPKKEEIYISHKLFTKDGKPARDTLSHELGHTMNKDLKEIISSDELLEEARNLSKLIKPIRSKKPEYIAYRMSPEEVFADFVAAYIVAPGLANREAPNLVESFGRYLDKPENKKRKNHFINANIQANGAKEARILQRKLKIKMMHEKTTYIKHEMDTVRAIESNSLNFLELTYMYLLDKSVGLRKLERKALTKLGERASELDINAYFEVKHCYQNLVFLLEDIRHSGITYPQVSYLLELLKTVTMEEDIARPLGIAKESAEENLKYEKEDMGEEKYNLALSFINRLQEWWMDSVITPAYEAGIFTQDLYDEIVAERKRGFIYKPDSVIDKNVVASIREIKGTVEPVKDPFVAFVLKAERIVKAMVQNQAKVLFIDSTIKPLLEANNKDFVEIPYEDKPPLFNEEGLELITYKRGGRTYATYVDRYAKEFFQAYGNEFLNKIINYKGILKNINNLLRGIYVNYNPVYLFVANPIRDTMRTFLHMPKGITPIGYMKYVKKAYKHAYDRASGKHNPFVQKLESLGALNPIRKSFQDEIIIDKAPKRISEYVDYLIRQYNVPKTDLPTTLNPFKQMLRAGTTLENIHKIAMFMMFTDEDRGFIGEGKMFEDEKQVARFVRRYYGSANFTVKGLASTNDVFLFIFSKSQEMITSLDRMFTSINKESTGVSHKYVPRVYTEEDFDKSDEELNEEVEKLIREQKKTRGFNYKMTLAILTMLGWNLLHRGILTKQMREELNFNLLDDDALDDFLLERKAMWANIPDYEKNNYYIFPLRMIEGETLYMRIPLTGALILANTFSNQIIDGLTEGDIKKIAYAPVATLKTLNHTFSPALSIPSNWIKYAMGEAVSDPFMKYQILTKHERNVGGWQAHKKMIDWTLEQLGAGKLISLGEDLFAGKDYRNKNKAELVKQIPLAGKLFRITSTGMKHVSDSKLVNDANRYASQKVLHSEDYTEKFMNKYFNELDRVNDMTVFEKAIRPLKTLVNLLFTAQKIEQDTQEETVEKTKTVLSAYRSHLLEDINSGALKESFQRKYGVYAEPFDRESDADRYMRTAVNITLKKFYPKIYGLLSEVRQQDSPEAQHAAIMHFLKNRNMTQDEWLTLQVLIGIGKGVSPEAYGKQIGLEEGLIDEADLKWLHQNFLTK